MSATAPTVDAKPPAAAPADVVLYQSERSFVVRRQVAGGETVVLKRASGNLATKRLKQERALLARLKMVHGIARLAAGEWPDDTLALQDDAGITLAQAIAERPLSVEETVSFGLDLAAILTSLHRQGVVHKDINPTNLLLAGPTRRAVLIDFNIAGSFGEERSQERGDVPAPGQQFAGTLAYMPPEQTGRTGRPVDLRSDLYAMGVVLYQLLTGRMPFETDDLLEILQHQLTTVPKAPVEIDESLPPVLSQLVMKLLEKEPDLRYQSAEGVAHDLQQWKRSQALGVEVSFALGRRDFPARLAAPARLIGRDREIAALQATLDAAITGPGQFVLVTGESGVGKTVLVDQLREMAAAQGGWFVSGKFDAYRREVSGAVHALRNLGKLLLSQPEAELAACKARMTEVMRASPNPGISRLPEFELLLGARYEPQPLDPLESEAHAFKAVVDTLAVVVSHERPLVMLLDDLQWSIDASARYVDALLAARDRLPGLVLALALRPAELPAGHAMVALLERWQQHATPNENLRLAPLDREGTTEMVGKMLRFDAAQAAPLGAVLFERSLGNPQQTVELVNELRSDGLLTPDDDDGWRWDEDTIRRYVGDNDGVDLLARRLGRLPTGCRSAMEVLACLGGEVHAELLAAACGPAVGDIHLALAPAIDDGLVVAEVRREVVFHFRNNRVQECVHALVTDTGRLQPLRLAVARRLAPIAEYVVEASEQYLEVVDLVVDAAEQRRVACLLLDGLELTTTLKYEARERYTEAALRLMRAVEEESDAALVMMLLDHRHQAMYALGRHAEAEQVYSEFARRCTDPFQLVGPGGVQLHSYANSGRNADGLALGMHILGRLGLRQPADIAAELGANFAKLSAWAHGTEKEADLVRPEATAREVVEVAKFIKRVLTPAFHTNKPLHTWLLLECHRMWTVHGPNTWLMSTVASMPLLLAATADYRGASIAAEHALKVAQARGYEQSGAAAGSVSALCAFHWAQPIEDVVPFAERARVVLEKFNDVQYAGYAYPITTSALLDTARTLDDADEQGRRSFAFVQRTGHAVIAVPATIYRQVVRAMRGETASPGSFDDAETTERELAESGAKNNTAPALFHGLRAVAALIYDDMPTLRDHARRAMGQVATMPGFYATHQCHLMHAIGLADQIRQGAGDAGEALLVEFDKSHHWMAQRAADQPVNFGHLVHWLAAERAWALGDRFAALDAFEAAQVDVEQRRRPWHRALILERAARFYLAHGWDHAARPLLGKALHGWEEWGATGKVRALQTEFPFLAGGPAMRRATVGGRSTIVSGDAVDMMAILRASQALSSETSLAQLNACLAQVLGAMCGAESVLLAVQPREMSGWFLATSLEQGSTPVSVDDAAAKGQLLLSAFRYAERTREALLLENAARDPRFGHDPALAGVQHCSLLMVPVMQQGELQAMLVMENRSRHSAFSAERLDAVSLIAGQLAVSLDNALLYASLERKVAERTAALEEANRKLEALSITDALTGLANRRHFNQAFDAEWERARRSGLPIGIAMIDIDEFKQYNDHYGHQGGDSCLKGVADAMKSVLRGKGDLIARYGGEEFVLLLPGSDLLGATRAAERVRAAVAAKQAPHVKARHGIVSISVGTASITPSAGYSPQQLVERADAALYEAKRGGRNRVVPGIGPDQTAPAPIDFAITRL